MLCGFRTKLSAFGDDFHQSRLLTRMTQSWSFSPDAHIPLQNKKKLARQHILLSPMVFGDAVSSRPNG